MYSEKVSDMQAIAKRAIGAYLGLAIGDALGATVEFMTPREIRAAYGIHDRLRGGGWLRLRPGQVTDDTGMSLALGQAILERGGVEAEAVARAFDAWMRSKPVDIGHTVRRGVQFFRHTGCPESPPSEHDAGNGAAMRVLPVAIATLGEAGERVRASCRVQAHVTHNNPLSDAATECLALMLQDGFLGADKHQLLQEHATRLVERHPQFAFQGRQPRINPSGYVVETLQAVFQALSVQESFYDTLVDVANRGGDADTTSAIAGMLCGAIYGPGAIPSVWLTKLDRSIGKGCIAQAKSLCGLAPLFRQRNL